MQTYNDFPLESPGFDEKKLFGLLHRYIRPPLDPLEQGRLTSMSNWRRHAFLLTDDDKEKADRLWEAAQRGEEVNFRETFYDPYYVLLLRRRYLEDSREELKALGVKFNRTKRIFSGPNFDKLPSEIHLLIFDFLDDYFHALSLTLTSTYFWRVGKNRLMRLIHN
ncbi:hypothetical protein PM082_000304 [Marasmius tenuissimus]|nr:hypothetical protein PM082_000304 [Marasmius tenuissimus]